jgi:Flp pilus assembly protein TadD
MYRYRIEIAVCLGLAALTLGAMGHAYANGFVNYDDGDYVVRNAQVREGLSWAGTVWAFATTHAANWHPLTWLSLQLDAALFGSASAWGFHLTNVLLHTANVVLLFLALRRLTGAVWRSAAVAALFAVHPAHVESVAWVAERKDVLSGLFWMLTLLAYAFYAERPNWQRYLLVLAAFALGLMAKPMLVTLPCVLLLLDYWPLQRVPAACGSVPGRKRLGILLVEKLPLFALTAAACLVTLYAQRQGGAVNTLEQLPLRDRLLNTAAAYTGYLAELVWPAGLAPFYPHPREHLLLEQAVRAGVVLALITGVVIWAWRRRYLTVGWLWFLGTLVPVIGLVQVGGQAMADRYTYIPYIGLFIALVWLAADLAAPWSEWASALIPWVAGLLLRVGIPSGVTYFTLRRLQSPLAGLLLGIWVPLALWSIPGPGAEPMADGLIYRPVTVLTVLAVLGWCGGRLAGWWPARVSPLVPVFALLLGLCVALSAWQTRLWHNSIWLWEYTVAVTNDNPTAHNNLGDAYWNAVNPYRVEQARAHFLAALRLAPTHSRAHNNLGLVYMELGQLEQAAAEFQAACDLDPTLSVAPLNLGVVLALQGDFAGAIAQHQAALRLDPNSAAVHDYLGQAQAGAGQWQEAVQSFQRATELAPAEKDYRADLAWALGHLGRKDEAAKEYAAVIAQDEEWPEKTRCLAWTAATTGRRSSWETVRRAEEACQARGGCEPRYLDTLAVAYAQAGCIDAAVRAARQALQCPCDDEAFRAVVWQRLLGYLDRRPYYESVR